MWISRNGTMPLVVAAILSLTLPAGIAAQAAGMAGMAGEGGGTEKCQAAPDHGDKTRPNDNPETGSITKKLDNCGSVLKPPRTGDANVVKPPQTGEMPVIKPGELPQQPKQD